LSLRRGDCAEHANFTPQIDHFPPDVPRRPLVSDSVADIAVEQGIGPGDSFVRGPATREFASESFFLRNQSGRRAGEGDNFDAHADDSRFEFGDVKPRGSGPLLGEQRFVENLIDYAVQVSNRAIADVDFAPDARGERFCFDLLFEMLAFIAQLYNELLGRLVPVSDLLGFVETRLEMLSLLRELADVLPGDAD
jgi:hypothetical protein